MTRTTYNITVAIDTDEAAAFIGWLRAQGHTAKLGRDTAGSIEPDAPEAMRELWEAYCDSPAPTFAEGDRVEGGGGDDYDIGTIIEPVAVDEINHRLNDGHCVYVAWDSGVRTWTPTDLLRRA